MFGIKEDNSEEEFDPQLQKTVDDVFDGTSEEPDISIDHLFDLIKPAPERVPKLLNLKPSEFMEAPFEHFQALCEEYSYSKVISSLTYIRNVAHNDSEEVKNRVKQLQETLKHQRTTSASDGQNKQDDPDTSKDDSESSQ